MEQGRMRALRVVAKVCLWLALTCAAFRPSLARAEAAPAELAPLQAPIVLAATDTLPGVVVYPARVAGSRPITVVLHGMCGFPEHACAYFAERVTERENLVCPRASESCAGGGSSWASQGFADKITAAVERAKSVLPAAPDESAGRTLVGYSLGGFRALELAQSSAGTYRRVMLIGARVFANAALLRKNGVERLLFAAGERDMTHEHMRRESQRLARNGLSAEFLGLGPVGHFFQPSFAEYLPRALAWLREPKRDV